MKVSRLLLLILVPYLLTGCKAEKVEVSLTSETLLAATSGKATQVDFEAVVGEKYATVDEEKRQLIDSVSSLIKKYFPNVDVEADIGANEYEIEIDGELIVSDKAPTSGSPWYISTAPIDDGSAILVQLLPSASFSSFSSELQSINLMLSLEEFQPVEFRFSAPSGSVLVGGAIIDGRPVGTAVIPMSGQTLKMLFKDGVWDQTSGSFLYLP